jgi:hypothetical protein
MIDIVPDSPVLDTGIQVSDVITMRQIKIS